LHTHVTCSLDLMIHLCSGWDQSGPREVPNLSPTIATSPWKSAAGTPSMAALSAHKDSMMVVKVVEHHMQGFMPFTSLSSQLENCSVPWKSDGTGDARRRFRGLGSSALLVMTIRRHTTQFQPRVGPCCPGSILARSMQMYANPKSTAKSIGLYGTRMASRVRLANDAGSKGQLTGGGVPYL
jgi:hypothetical protein